VLKELVPCRTDGCAIYSSDKLPIIQHSMPTKTAACSTNVRSGMWHSQLISVGTRAVVCRTDRVHTPRLVVCKFASRCQSLDLFLVELFHRMPSPEIHDRCNGVVF
jgi:hypothetical protein